MKLPFLVIFITIVTVIYSLVNFYIYSRAVQLIPAGAPKTGFTIIFWLFASTFILARFLEKAAPCNFTEVITWIGSFYLGFMVYGLLMVVFTDLLRLFNHFVPVLPDLFHGSSERTKLLVFLSAMSVLTLIVLAGFINARITAIRNLEITIDKPAVKNPDLRIVMVSDIHMGTLIAKRRTNTLIRTINELKPDLILFAGDIVDEDLAPVIRRDLGGQLKLLKSKYGVYGITGNHEYIGGVEPAVRYLTEHGISMLRDTSVLVDGQFYLVGREDRDKPRFTGKERKSLDEVMQGVDTRYPVILMDHQPFNLENPVRLGVDLQLSGHTHHGQVWPFNYITNAIYTISTGYRQIGNTHFYVSSGFGSWGPPIRLGNRPEIVVITLKVNR